MKEITKQSLENLKKELLDLKIIKRAEVAERIKEAKEFGDLSENSEYEDAKNEQAFAEGRIAELENLIKNAVVVGNGGSSGVVAMGCQITVVADGQEEKYSIVDFTEVDAAKGHISSESPLGKAFMGKKIGDTIHVMVPVGEITMKIKEIK